jgi:MFS transporter, putative metabolite:H+ symporter
VTSADMTVPVAQAGLVETVLEAQETDTTAADVIVARMERLPFTRKHWAIAVLLSTGTFFDAFDSLIIGSVLAVIVTSLGITIQAAGILISAAFAGQLLGALVAGVLSELVGRRLVLLGTLLIFGLMALVCAFAQDLNQLYVARIIQGFGLGAEVPIAGALFNEFVRGRTRGLVVGLYENAFNLAVNIAPLIALIVYGLVGNDLGWRVLFGIGALPLFATFIRRSVLPESPRWLVQKGRVTEAEAVVASFEAEARRAGQPLPEPVVKPLTLPKRTNFFELFGGIYRQRTIQVWLQWFCAYSVSSYGALLPALYVAGGLQVSQALTVQVVANAINFAYSFFMIPQFDRWGRKPLFIAGFGAAAVALLTGAFVVGVLGIKDWYVLAIVAAVVTMGALPSTLGLYIYTPELYPTRMRAWGTAAATSMNRLAQTVGPALAGILIASAFGIAAVFALNGVIALIGVVSVLWLGIETKGRVLEEIAA